MLSGVGDYFQQFEPPAVPVELVKNAFELRFPEFRRFSLLGLH